jgi:hypothetical protein
MHANDHAIRVDARGQCLGCAKLQLIFLRVLVDVCSGFSDSAQHSAPFNDAGDFIPASLLVPHHDCTGPILLPFWPGWLGSPE